MATRNVFRAKTLADLMDAIYRHEGWRRQEGDSRAKRVNAAFEVSTDHRRSDFVARRREGGAA
jgi:hypothetical protein